MSSENTNSHAQFPNTFKVVLSWIVLGSIVGVLCGLSSGLFLYLLEKATDFRISNIWLVYLLPLAGAALGFVMSTWGSRVSGGNNLVLDTLHVDTSERLPKRMAPLVLFGTIWTHLFGGSAGREGTAVQMGASLADRVAHFLKLNGSARVQLLSAGIAGGFGAVFGTPFAGTIFGIEVLRIGRMEYHALIPALIGAIIGDFTTRALGIGHTHYPVVAVAPLTLLLIAKLLAFSLAAAAASAGFIELAHGIKREMKKRVPNSALRMAIGGAVVIALWQLSDTDDYLGLGVPTIVRAFSDPALPYSAFVWKIIFTAVTLGVGFIGGEVTPLFFIGATLGNTMARLLNLPLDLAAACGFAAVFGAAANTPIACAVMAVELFGAGVFPYVAIVCIFAYLLTGHRSIYPSQRISFGKLGHPIQPERSLHELE